MARENQLSAAPHLTHMTAVPKPKGQSAVAKIIVTAIIGLLLLFLLIPALQTFGRRLLTSSEEILIGDEVGTDGATSGGRVLDLVTLLPPDRIPAILNPQFVSAFEAGDWMEDDEQVLGLSIEGEHRAYAIKMLSQHEIVNDVVGGKPVAVTW